VIPANATAREQLANDPLMKDFFILDKEGFANMMPIDWKKIDITKFTEDWNRAISR
jgi:hypothetical protein